MPENTPKNPAAGSPSNTSVTMPLTKPAAPTANDPTATTRPATPSRVPAHISQLPKPKPQSMMNEDDSRSAPRSPTKLTQPTTLIPATPARPAATNLAAQAGSPSSFTGQGRGTNTQAFLRPNTPAQWGQGRLAHLRQPGERPGGHYGPAASSGRITPAGRTPLNATATRHSRSGVTFGGQQGSPLKQSGDALHDLGASDAPSIPQNVTPAGAIPTLQLVPPATDRGGVDTTDAPAPATPTPQAKATARAASPAQEQNFKPKPPLKRTHFTPTYKVKSEHQPNPPGTKARKAAARLAAFDQAQAAHKGSTDAIEATDQEPLAEGQMNPHVEKLLSRQLGMDINEGAPERPVLRGNPRVPIDLGRPSGWNKNAWKAHKRKFKGLFSGDGAEAGVFGRVADGRFKSHQFWKALQSFNTMDWSGAEKKYFYNRIPRFFYDLANEFPEGSEQTPEEEAEWEAKEKEFKDAKAPEFFQQSAEDEGLTLQDLEDDLADLNDESNLIEMLDDSQDDDEKDAEVVAKVEQLLAAHAKLEQNLSITEAQNQQLRTDNEKLQAEMATASGSLAQAAQKYKTLEQELAQNKRKLTDSEAKLKKQVGTYDEKEIEIQRALEAAERAEAEAHRVTEEMEAIQKRLTQQEEDHGEDFAQVDWLYNELKEVPIRQDEPLKRMLDAIQMELETLWMRDSDARKLKNADDLKIERMVEEAELARMHAQQELKKSETTADKLKKENELLKSDAQALAERNKELSQQYDAHLDEAGTYKLILQDLSGLMPDMVPPDIEHEFDRDGQPNDYLNDSFRQRFRAIVDENRILRHDLDKANEKVQRRPADEPEVSPTPLSESFKSLVDFDDEVPGDHEGEDDTASDDGTASQSSASGESVTQHSLTMFRALAKELMVSRGVQTDETADARTIMVRAAPTIPGISSRLPPNKRWFLLALVPFLSWVYTETQWAQARQERAVWVAANYDTLAYRDRQVYGYTIPRDRTLEYMAHKFIDFLGFPP